MNFIILLFKRLIMKKKENKEYEPDGKSSFYWHADIGLSPINIDELNIVDKIKEYKTKLSTYYIPCKSKL